MNESNKPEQLLTKKQVKPIAMVGDTKLWEDVKAGRLPKPIKRGRNNFWLESEVREAVAKQIETARQDRAAEEASKALGAKLTEARKRKRASVASTTPKGAEEASQPKAA